MVTEIQTLARTILTNVCTETHETQIQSKAPPQPALLHDRSLSLGFSEGCGPRPASSRDPVLLPQARTQWPSSEPGAAAPPQPHTQADLRTKSETGPAAKLELLLFGRAPQARRGRVSVLSSEAAEAWASTRHLPGLVGRAKLSRRAEAGAEATRARGWMEQDWWHRAGLPCPQAQHRD